MNQIVGSFASAYTTRGEGKSEEDSGNVVRERHRIYFEVDNSGNLKENALILEKLQGTDFGLPFSIFGPRNMLTVFVASAIPRMNETWILRMSLLSSFLKILPNIFSLSLTSFHPAFRNPFLFVLDISPGPAEVIADHIVLERHLHSTDLSAHKLEWHLTNENMWCAKVPSVQPNPTSWLFVTRFVDIRSLSVLSVNILRSISSFGRNACGNSRIPSCLTSSVAILTIFRVWLIKQYPVILGTQLTIASMRERSRVIRLALRHSRTQAMMR